MSDKVIIKFVSSDFNSCCFCGKTNLVYQASDGHFYCNECRQDRVTRGEADLGEFTAAAKHKCIYAEPSPTNEFMN